MPVWVIQILAHPVRFPAGFLSNLLGSWVVWQVRVVRTRAGDSTPIFRHYTTGKSAGRVGLHNMAMRAGFPSRREKLSGGLQSTGKTQIRSTCSSWPSKPATS